MTRASWFAPGPAVLLAFAGAAVVQVESHGAMVHPRSRNSIDAFSNITTGDMVS